MRYCTVQFSRNEQRSRTHRVRTWRPHETWQAPKSRRASYRAALAKSSAIFARPATLRFHSVAAHPHAAPSTRTVLRAIVECPAATAFAAGFQPAKRAGRHGVVDNTEQSRQYCRGSVSTRMQLRRAFRCNAQLHTPFARRRDAKRPSALLLFRRLHGLRVVRGRLRGTPVTAKGPPRRSPGSGSPAGTTRSSRPRTRAGRSLPRVQRCSRMPAAPPGRRGRPHSP